VNRNAWKLAVIGSAGVVLAAAVVFGTSFRHELFPKRLVELEPNLLFRSGQISSRLIRDTLADNDIRVIIDLQAADNWPEHRAEALARKELGIRYSRFRLAGDGTGDPHNYALAIAAIDQAREQEEPTLVHCAAGARRTGGVIAMYDVLVRGRSTEEAYDELDRYGSPPVAETRLLAYLNRNMRTIARDLVDLGVIKAVPFPLPRFSDPTLRE
jgi:protein tyrosine/serine phosphatase